MLRAYCFDIYTVEILLLCSTQCFRDKSYTCLIINKPAWVEVGGGTWYLFKMVAQDTVPMHDVSYEIRSVKGTCLQRDKLQISNF